MDQATGVLTLTEFLTARIAEDEAPTFELIPYDCEPGCCAPAGWVGRRCLICDDGPSFGGEVEAIKDICREHEEMVHRRSRALAECVAKRRIVEQYTKEQWVISQGHRTEWTEGGQAARETALRLLATVYADHPDYRQEWKP